MSRLPRLGRLVWLAYAALLGVAQASLAFAWAVHAHSGGSSAHHHHHGGSGCSTAHGSLCGPSLALQPTPSQQQQHQQRQRRQQLLLAGAAGAGLGHDSSSGSSSSRHRRSVAMAAAAAASPPSSPTAPPPPLQHAATVRLCAAIIRGARGGGFRARSKTAVPSSAAAAGEEPSSLLSVISKGRGRVALKAASSSSSFEQPQEPPAGGQRRQRGRGGGRRGAGEGGEMDGDGGMGLLPERPKQELSSTVAILGAGVVLTALAAVLPTGLEPGSPTVLGALLASLKPAPGVVLTGPALYWRIFLAGGVCASISHGWAVPLDVVKTRLQTDPERYRGLGIWAALDKIRVEEGAGMLLKGLGATLTGYSIQGALKYGLYALFKTLVKGWLPQASILVTFGLASILADFIASTALCPLEATRIRLVADPGFASGTLEGISRLVEEEGAGSVFKGMPAILAKQLPYTIVQLCGFELITWLFYSWEATAALLQHSSAGVGQWLVSFGSAMITAVFASLASQPGDVILSRVNKDRSSKPVLATMSDTVKDLGLRGLFKGTRARLLHVGMIVTIQLVIYDFVKTLVGLPATGAH